MCFSITGATMSAEKARITLHDAGLYTPHVILFPLVMNWLLEMDFVDDSQFINTDGLKPVILGG